VSVRLYLGAGAVSVALSFASQAQTIDEARFGVLHHNICVADCKNANKEDGPTVEGELVFATPDLLRPLLSPRPYLIASLNTAGDTSYAGGGFLWTFDFAERWGVEPSLGYVIHDGELSNPFANSTPEAAAFFEENILFGSRDLFRTGLALNYDLSDDWGLQLQYEHLSHGQMLGNGRNQGVDSIGVRTMVRF